MTWDISTLFNRSRTTYPSNQYTLWMPDVGSVVVRELTNSYRMTIKIEIYGRGDEYPVYVDSSYAQYVFLYLGEEKFYSNYTFDIDNQSNTRTSGSASFIIDIPKSRIHEPITLKAGPTSGGNPTRNAWRIYMRSLFTGSDWASLTLSLNTPLILSEIIRKEPNISPKIDGVYRDYVSGAVKIGGVWREIDEIHTKINNVWRKSE